MSTANFKTLNASKVFCVYQNEFYNPETGESQTERPENVDDFETVSRDSYEVIEDLSERLGKSWSSMDEWTKDRYYPGLYFGEKSFKSVWFGDFEFHVDVKMILRCGYYTDYNIDYEINLCSNYYEPNELNDFTDDEDMAKSFTELFIYSLAYNNEGMKKIQAKNLIKAIEKQISEARNEAEQICENLSEDKYHCLGHFSNGEAIYSRC